MGRPAAPTTRRPADPHKRATDTTPCHKPFPLRPPPPTPTVKTKNCPNNVGRDEAALPEPTSGATAASGTPTLAFEPPALWGGVQCLTLRSLAEPPERLRAPSACTP